MYLIKLTIARFRVALHRLLYMHGSDFQFHMDSSHFFRVWKIKCNHCTRVFYRDLTYEPKERE